MYFKSFRLNIVVCVCASSITTFVSVLISAWSSTHLLAYKPHCVLGEGVSTTLIFFKIRNPATCATFKSEFHFTPTIPRVKLYSVFSKKLCRFFFSTIKILRFNLYILSVPNVKHPILKTYLRNLQEEPNKGSIFNFL